jgi:hypothetical protein
MNISDLKASSQEVLSDAACDATITNWVQEVISFTDTAADLKSRKPENYGGDTKVRDWIAAAMGLLDSFS